jgi:hypothetical protein
VKDRAALRLGASTFRARELVYRLVDHDYRTGRSTEPGKDGGEAHHRFASDARRPGAAAAADGLL